MTTHKLNDLQIILLSAASCRELGSLLPLPDAAASDLARTEKAITALIRKGLAEEAPTSNRILAWREVDQEPTGVFITAAGQQAIGLGAVDPSSVSDGGAAEFDGANAPVGEGATVPVVTTSQPRASSKNGLVVDLLRRPTGATLDELVAATGWLPHTTRAVLTGLRKKGHTVLRGKRDDVTCYSIEAAA